MTVATALLAHARRDPARRALSVGGHVATYAELAAGIEATAAWLRTSCSADAKIGVLLPNGRAFLELFLGVGQAGMAAMVLHPRWSDRELRFALRAGRPELVVTSARLAVRFRDELAPWRVVEADADSGLTPPSVDAEVGPPPDDGRAFYVGFTSGTTGGPKGFVRDHRSWVRSFEACRVFGVGADDEVAVPGDMAHSLFLFAALHALSEGAGVHLQSRFDASALAALLDELPISHLYVVPTMLSALLAASARRGTTARSRLRSLISSGAPWPDLKLREVNARFANAEVIDFYGSSEASFVSYRRVRAGDPPADLGRPFPGVELRVSDAVGPLWVRSDMLFSGYLDADATARVRDADGFVTTGDVVAIDAARRLRLIGRADAMLICGGVNVHPEEIERVLLDHPHVLEATVVGIPDPVWGQLPCAVLRVDGPGRTSCGTLRIHCRQRLAGPARPRRFLVVDVLPRTPNGKPDRRELTARVSDGSLAAEVLR